jgi:cytochrome c
VKCFCTPEAAPIVAGVPQRLKDLQAGDAGSFRVHGVSRRSLAGMLAGVALALAAGAAAAQSQDAAARGDPKAGWEIYARCTACHSLAHDRTGPRHCGLLGRRAGSVKGFGYSEAMTRSRIVWSAKTLDHFIENPVQALPGTSMGYSGVADPKERADLIAYLASVDTSSECRKRR